MKLTQDNYFSPEAAASYWSVSQFKTFNDCEARGLAEVSGAYTRPDTTALLVGSYVDAALTGDLGRYMDAHGEIFNKRTGTLKADFRHAETLIERVKADPLMVEYLTGEHQVIKTAELYGVPWKIKIDVLHDNRIVDLKTVKDFGDVFDPGYGWRSWIEFWGYDIQGAIYQRVEQIASGRPEPLPFYIAAVTKERVPDIKVIQIPQHVLDAAGALVESKIERFDLIKSGDVEPIRCGSCDYCKSTKVLTAPEIYEIKEG